MLRRTGLILGTVLLVLTASIAEAQTQKRQQGGQRPGGQGGQGGPGGFGAGVTTLLGMPEVLKELSVTDEQKGLIDNMLRDLRASAGGGGGGGFNRQDFQNLSDEERQKRMEELRKQGEERTKKAEDTAKLILEPKQFERLTQLRIQRKGITALERGDVAEKLEMTQDQKDKIRKIREESRGDRGGFGNLGNLSQEERDKALAEARDRREKSNASILAVLTPKQKETWDQMQGKKFAFPQQQGFGGRPGGQGGDSQGGRPATKKRGG